METIQKMYRVNRIVSDDRLIGLQNWYNQVIMKQPDELDLKDVSIMIRQRLFLKTAVNKAIAFLEKDPLSSDQSYITTYHVKSAAKLAKKAPSLFGGS